MVVALASLGFSTRPGRPPPGGRTVPSHVLHPSYRGHPRLRLERTGVPVELQRERTRRQAATMRRTRQTRVRHHLLRPHLVPGVRSLAADGYDPAYCDSSETGTLSDCDSTTSRAARSSWTSTTSPTATHRSGHLRALQQHRRHVRPDHPAAGDVLLQRLPGHAALLRRRRVLGPEQGLRRVHAVGLRLRRLIVPGQLLIQKDASKDNYGRRLFGRAATTTTTATATSSAQRQRPPPQEDGLRRE